MSVELWFAVVLLATDWSPLPTFTPGFTLTPVPPAAALSDPVVDDWLVAALWSIVDDELMSVELWFALTLLDTD
jgi:hypothetical protein